MARLLDGVRVIVLTNGGDANTRNLLDGSGLLGQVERVVSIDEVGTWKPRAEVYRHAAGAIGVEPGRLGLIAAHAWDCHGAHRAGLVSEWVSRHERVVSPAFDPPDVRAETLPGVAEAMLRLPEG
nr:HAD hydrolase-like protein [Tautonia plasticadhaerens]